MRQAIVQADALCRLGERAGAQAILSLTEQLNPQQSSGIQSEFALTRGRCAEKPDSAREFFSRAASLAHGNDEFIEAAALLNIGFGLLHEERYAEAINKFLEGLNVTGSPLLRNRMLGNIGFAYSQLGDWRSAIRFSNEAAKTAAEIKNDEAQENWLIDLGKAHFALWDLQEAETAYLKALSIAQQLGPRKNTALCYRNLALLALRRRDVPGAEAYRKRGEALNIESERLYFALVSARVAVLQERWPEAERMLLDLLPRTAGDPLLHFQVQRDLGRVYWHEKKDLKADQAFRDGIAGAEKALSKLNRPEFRMSFMDQATFYDSYIQFLVAQKKPLDALTIAERSRAQVLAAAFGTSHSGTAALSIKALQSLSKQRGQTILSYAMTDEKTFLWVITPSQFKVLELPGHFDLKSQILAFNQEIQDHRDVADSPHGIKLYEALIQPAENLIQGTSVVVIPSKLLSLVNFEALVVPGSKPGYWIQNVDVQVASSLAFLAGARSAHNAGKSTKALLAIGAPVEASKDFPPLKFAPEEIQRVENHFPPAERVVVYGKGATPQAYGSSNPGQFRYIHLDTHGVASDLNPLDSAVILSPGADNSYKLHAQEIKDIPLHADLVTISACYGAGTRWYQGEGIVGLAWAFLRAGAHQVVAALWEVDDASSPQLMDEFYSELVQGKSASEALHDAKLSMVHSTDFHRHPYYWASLQLYTGP